MSVPEFQLLDVDETLVDRLRAYAHAYGPAHDDSHVSAGELATFDPQSEPAAVAVDGSGQVIGAASVMLTGYAREGLARFRILHALDPAAYPALIERAMARLPEQLRSVYLFLPEHADQVAGFLSAAGFAESRRAYIMLHGSPVHAQAPELPGETALHEANPTMGADWAHIVNAAFRGQPGRYDLTPALARELLDRPEVIRSGTLMAYRGGTPAAVVMTVADERNPFSAEIETIAVLPPDQQVGLGRGLLHAALVAAGQDGRSSVTLSVSTFNKRALALYLDAGFVVHDVRVCWERRLA